MLTDWPAIAAYNSIPLPKSVADALANAGQSLTYFANPNPDLDPTPRHPHSSSTPTVTATATRSATIRNIGTSPGPLKETHRTADTDHTLNPSTKDRDHHSNLSPFTGTGRVSPHRRVNPFNPRAASPTSPTSPTSPSNTHDQPNHSPTSPRSTTSSGSGSSHSSNSVSGPSRKVDRSARERERDRDRDRDRDRVSESTMASTRHAQDNSPKGASDPNVNIREKQASWSPIREKGATTSQKERRSDERSREYERGKDYQYSVGRKAQPQQMHPIVTISKATAPQAFSKSSRPSLPSCQRQEVYTKLPQAQAVPASAPPTASMRRLASVADTSHQRDPIPSVPLPRTTRAQAPSLTAMMANMSVDAAYSAYPSRFPVNNNNNNNRLSPPELTVPHRPPNPSPPASQTSSNSSNSSAQDGTVISDGAFTDYVRSYVSLVPPVFSGC